MRQIVKRVLRRAAQNAYSFTERVLKGRRVSITEYPVELIPRYGWDDRPVHPELDRLLGFNRDRYADLLDACTDHLPALRSIPRVTDDAAEARWENSYFSGLDVVVLYHEILRRRPHIYLEVGSGHSTRFARRAVRDAGLSTRIVSIDPAPRAEVDELCDEVQRCTLSEADLSIVDELGPDDIVVVDGSHLCTMGADTVVAFLEVIPRLPSGTLLGVDDVFLPWDYPPTWTRRMYGEQYLVATMLLSSGDWNVVFPSWWAANDPGLSERVAAFEDPARHTRFGLAGSVMWMTRGALPRGVPESQDALAHEPVSNIS